MARAWCRTTTVTQSDSARCVLEGRPLSWPVRCIALSPNVSVLPAGVSGPLLRELLVTAQRAWSGARCGGRPPSVDLSVGEDTSAGSSYSTEGANQNVVLFRRDWTAAGLPPSALAITTVTFGASSGEIRDTDVQVNLTQPLSVSATARGNDLPTILLHEVGHVLGIDHSDDRSAVMYYASGRGEQRRALTADDVAAVCGVHPPDLQRPCAPPSDAGCACAAPAVQTRPTVAWLLVAGLLLLRRRPAG